MHIFAEAAEHLPSVLVDFLGGSLTLNAWLGKLADERTGTKLKPKKSAYGLLAQYGPGPSAEEIDENRREIFRSFGEDTRGAALPDRP